MRGVGVPGGPHTHRRRGRRNRAKAALYRQSDAGRLARKYYHMRPEVKLYMKIRRQIKRHMKGKA